MREYLERHLEPQSDRKKVEGDPSANEWLDLFPESTRRELAPELKFGESGTEVIELPHGGQLTFSYEPVSEDTVEEYRKIDRPLTASDFQEEYKYLALDSRVGKMESGFFRKLTSLSIRTASEKEVNLTGISARNIFFAVRNPALLSSVIDEGTNDVFLYGPPTTFLALLVLFHEIGHGEYSKRFSEKERRKNARRRGSYANEIKTNPLFGGKRRAERFENNAEMVLREERGAWAEALARLRHVLPEFDVSKEDVLKSVHEITLGNRSDKIRDRMAREPRIFQMLDSMLGLILSKGSRTNQNTTVEGLA